MMHHSSINHKRTAEDNGYNLVSDSKRRLENEEYFLKLAMMDLYGIGEDDDLKKGMKGRSIEAFEKQIVDKKKLSQKNYYSYFCDESSMSNIQLSCIITIDSPNDLKVQFNDPKRLAKSNFFHREFHPLRFMKAIIKMKKIEKCDPNANERNIAVVCSENSLFKEGIEFGGLRYIFLGGEKNDKIEEGYFKITAWFFVESKWHDKIRTTVQELREFIGDFGDQKDLKINARLKLGFTETNAYLSSLSDENISVIDDICNGDDKTKIMTDGCGLIAVSLSDNIHCCHFNPSLPLVNA